MRYKYQTTSDFNLGEDWILYSLGYDDVSFRFVVETYSGVTKSVWMSPHQASDYMRYVKDYIYRFYSFKVVKRIKILPF